MSSGNSNIYYLSKHYIPERWSRLITPDFTETATTRG